MKTRFIIILLPLIFLSACLSSGDKAQSIRTYDSYRGMYSFPMDIETWKVMVPEPEVIRNQEDFISFKQSIPEYEMTPQNPAPKSDDPLLTLDSIDWSSRMLLVIYSFSDNTFIDLQISDVKVKNRTLMATANYFSPDPRDIQQKIVDYGLYYALIVDRFDGEVLFNTIEIPAGQ